MLLTLLLERKQLKDRQIQNHVSRKSPVASDSKAIPHHLPQTPKLPQTSEKG